MFLPSITVPLVLMVEGPVYRVRVAPVCCHPVVEALGHTADEVSDDTVEDALGCTVGEVPLGGVSGVDASPCPEARRATVTAPRVRKPTAASPRRLAFTITPIALGSQGGSLVRLPTSRMPHQVSFCEDLSVRV
jgi:hypothetical protein